MNRSVSCIGTTLPSTSCSLLALDNTMKATTTLKRKRSCRRGMLVAACCFLSSAAAFTATIAPSSTTSASSSLWNTATTESEQRVVSIKEWKETAEHVNKSFPMDDIQQPANISSLPFSNNVVRTTTKRNRSSTMRTFATKSQRQQHYEKSVRLVEQRTGTKQSFQQVKARQKLKSRHMYANSLSVPDSMVQFAAEIHREERITRAQEIHLGQKAQEGMRVQQLFEHLEKQYGREPTDEEWCAAAGKINVQAISEAIDEGLQAKNRLVTSNLRMVQSVVNTYIRNGLGARYNAGDLMQEGVMALIRAAEKYEPDRGFKFSTYAMYWVRSSVKRSHVLQSRSIPVPQRLYDRNKQLRRIEQDMIMASTHGSVRPTRKELGEAVGISEKQVDSCFRAMQMQCFSIDGALTNRNRVSSGADSGTFVELIADGESDKANQELLREDLIQSMQKHLDPVQMELLLLRYGVPNTTSPSTSLPAESIHQQVMEGKQITVAEMSRRLGIKPWKIRQAIDQSLATLKAAGVDEWRGFAEELQ